MSNFRVLETKTGNLEVSLENDGDDVNVYLHNAGERAMLLWLSEGKLFLNPLVDTWGIELDENRTIKIGRGER